MVDSGAFSKAAQKRAQSRNGTEDVLFQPGTNTPDTLSSEERTDAVNKIAERVSSYKRMEETTGEPAGVAQRIEQSRPKGEIGGSIPLAGTKETVTQSGWNPYPQEPIYKDEVIPTPKLTFSQEEVKKPEPKIERRAQMKKGERAQFMVLRSIGNFLVLMSLYGVAATFGPALSSEVKYQVAQMRGIQYTVKDTPEAIAVQPSGSITPTPVPARVEPGFGDVLAGTTEQVLIPPDTQFSIVVPKIGATSKVFPNVDPVKESEFVPVLQQGVAHAKGTVFPGMEGNVYLFAHSTDNFWNVGRYNAIFYLIKELQPGDEIIVYFESKRFKYVVERSEVKDPTDVEFLTKSQEPGSQQLIMQTCWPPGTTWKRLFVIAKPAL